MKALYALSAKIASFDFFSWLVMAKAMGYTEVVFDTRYPKTDKWPLALVQKRFDSFMWPGPALAGMKASLGTEGTDPVHTDMKHLIAYVRAGNRIAPLSSVLPVPAESPRYTVTLRNEPRIPARNSNVAAWRTFAAEIGALVIEDYDHGPIDLHVRAALYAGAEMNFFVPNGPMHVCSLMGAPLLSFATDRCAEGLARVGIDWGQNYPWHTRDQRLVWEPDDLPVIRRVFDQWREERACKQESFATA